MGRVPTLIQRLTTIGDDEEELQSILGSYIHASDICSIISKF
jgi:hypothetical protein